MRYNCEASGGQSVGMIIKSPLPIAYLDDYDIVI